MVVYGNSIKPGFDKQHCHCSWPQLPPMLVLHVGHHLWSLRVCCWCKPCSFDLEKKHLSHAQISNVKGGAMTCILGKVPPRALPNHFQHQAQGFVSDAHDELSAPALVSWVTEMLYWCLLSTRKIFYMLQANANLGRAPTLPGPLRHKWFLVNQADDTSTPQRTCSHGIYILHPPVISFLGFLLNRSKSHSK